MLCAAAYEKADDARSDYVRMLDEQVRLKKERKEEEKRKQREREAREEREMREYNPWGKGGAGAPLRDASGAIVTDLRYDCACAPVSHQDTQTDSCC